MSRSLNKRVLKEMFRGREIVAGFDESRKNIVVFTDNLSCTLYAGIRGIELGLPLSMGIKITPKNVRCESIGFFNEKYLMFQLGRNRGLALNYMGRNDFHVCYLPDESDLEYGRSEFMGQCDNRGLM